MSRVLHPKSPLCKKCMHKKLLLLVIPNYSPFSLPWWHITYTFSNLCLLRPSLALLYLVVGANFLSYWQHGNTWKYTFVLKLTTVFAANEAGPKVCQSYDSLASIIPEVYWPSFKFRNVVSKIITHKSIANLWIWNNQCN